MDLAMGLRCWRKLIDHAPMRATVEMKTFFFLFIYTIAVFVVVAHRKLCTYLSSRYGKQTVVELKLKFLFMLLVCIELNRLLVSKLVFVWVCMCVWVLRFFIRFYILFCILYFLVFFSSSTCRFRIFRGVRIRFLLFFLLCIRFTLFLLVSISLKRRPIQLYHE